MNMHATPVNDTAPALLKNVAAMMTLVETIRDRPQMSSGFGVFSGTSGYGKTVASTYAQNNCDCIYVEVREFWIRGVTVPRGPETFVVEPLASQISEVA